MFIPVWKRVLVFVTVVLSLAYCIPSFIGKDGRDWMTQNLPSWMPTKTISLGLDLQGGSYILLQADINSVVKQRTDDIMTSLRTELRKKNMEPAGVTPIENGIEDSQSRRTGKQRNS